MNDRDAEFDALLRAAAEELRVGAPHPPPEELEAFQAGDLGVTRWEAVADHLSACSDCLERVRALGGLGAEAVGPPGSQPSPSEVEPAVAAVLARIRGDGRERRPFPVPEKPRWRLFPRWSEARGPYVLAASLLAATMAVVVWRGPLNDHGQASDLAVRLEELEREAASSRKRAGEAERLRAEMEGHLAELEGVATQLLAPRPNTPILDLRPRREREVGARAVDELRLREGVDLVTLVLALPTGAEAPRYRFDLRRPGGEVVAAAGGLEPNIYGSLTVTLHRTSLPPGELEVRLYGAARDPETLIARYPFVVRHEVGTGPGTPR